MSCDSARDGSSTPHSRHAPPDGDRFGLHWAAPAGRSCSSCGPSPCRAQHSLTTASTHSPHRTPLKANRQNTSNWRRDKASSIEAVYSHHISTGVQNKIILQSSCRFRRLDCGVSFISCFSWWSFHISGDQTSGLLLRSHFKHLEALLKAFIL